MLQDMELWATIRHALFVEGISKREATKRFGVNYRTINKIFHNEHPGTYNRAKPTETKLTPFISFIEEYLAEDKKLPRKQRHTKKRIYQRLRDEHGYVECATTVPVELFSLDGRPQLQQVKLPEPNIQVYSTLYLFYQKLPPLNPA